MDSLKLFALYILRAVGGFALAQRLTRHKLRILCYHGFSQGDEHQVLAWMFMSAETFERRLQILRKRRLPVIPLDEAIRKFNNHEIRNGETVITLDDGWASNLTVGLPLLKKYGYPACVYITTEHLDAQPEAFNVIVHYLIAGSRKHSMTLSDLHPQLDGTYELGSDRETTFRKLIAAVENAAQPSERLKLLGPIARALDVDLHEVLENDRFRLVNRSEIASLVRHGLDVQLHTHSHHLSPDDYGCVATEIGRNRDLIREITGADPRHFCYPSGLYKPCHPEWLARIGIVSATTCDPGLNAPGDSPLLLRRFLDYEDKPDIRFEAEICGIRAIMRSIIAAVGRPTRVRSGHDFS